MSTMSPAKQSTKRPATHRFDSMLDVPTTPSKRPHHQPISNPQWQSRLFSLPFELRHMIYEYALDNDAVSELIFNEQYNRQIRNSSSSSSTSTSTTSQHSALEPPLLFTCHLARTEALPVFYHTNDFLLNRRASLDFQHPLTMALSVAFPSPFLSYPSTAISSSAYKPPTTTTDTTNVSPHPPTNSITTTLSKAIKSSGSRWLYAMPDFKISQIRTVVFAQLGDGMYKDALTNEWRRDASACFRVRLDKRRAGGKGFLVEYIQVDGSGGSERYAERLTKALVTRMEGLVKEKMEKSGMEGGTLVWTRQDIWDMAYLL